MNIYMNFWHFLALPFALFLYDEYSTVQRLKLSKNKNQEPLIKKPDSQTT